MLPALLAAALLAPCSPAAAKSSLAQANVAIEGAPDKLICFDLTRDGRTDMAVTLFSGGTAGDIGFAVFRATAGGWKLALARRGYGLGLVRAGRDLVQTQPVYRKNDPNCCPAGGFDHARWHWDGSRFVVVRSWHDQRFRS